MKLVASWSGGKDSAFAVYQALLSGHTVSSLVTMVSWEFERSFSHGFPLTALALQSEALEIPMQTVYSAPEDYEKQLVQGLTRERKVNGAEGVIFGSLYEVADRKWNERVAEQAGLLPVFPLWIEEQDAMRLFQKWIGCGFTALITRAREDLFSKEIVGQPLSLKLISEEFPEGVCPMGEKGEFHTFVTNGPIFKRCIKVIETETVLESGLWSMDIKSAVLEDKS